jgi:hypothetical protein
MAKTYSSTVFRLTPNGPYLKALSVQDLYTETVRLILSVITITLNRLLKRQQNTLR